MSDIKMGRVFAGEVRRISSLEGPILADDCGELVCENKLDYSANAINTHDAMQDRITKLEALLNFTKSALVEDQAVIDTVWFDENTTLEDQIELTLEQSA